MPPADKRARQKANTQLARQARATAMKRRRRNRSLLSAGAVALVLILFVVLLNVIQGDDDNSASTSTTTPTTDSTDTTGATDTTEVTVPLQDGEVAATITTNLGDIVLALDTKNTPIGAEKFLDLAKNGTYDGSRWHRIIKDFVIQGGAPGGDLTKNVGNGVVAEVPTDHYPVGSLAAAKTGAAPPGTFEAQFFIVTGEEQGASLPNDYARFGRVLSGMPVVRQIEALPVDASDEPTAPATIDKITVDDETAATTTPAADATTTPTS